MLGRFIKRTAKLISGIYAITNTTSGKVYIGSTIDFKRRLGQHRTNLCGGYHDNPHLQAAWDCYGEDAFEFGVLEYLSDVEKLHLAEQFWMDLYREEGKRLYNHGLAARTPMLGRSHSEETRRKISKAGMGRTPSEETRRKISRAKMGNQGALGHQNVLGYRHSEEVRAEMSRTRAGPYPAFVRQETGEIIPAGRNLSALCREYNLSQTSMRNIMAGRQKQHRGWVIHPQGG